MSYESHSYTIMSDNRSSWLPCSAFPSRTHVARDGFGSARDTDTLLYDTVLPGHGISRIILFSKLES